MRHFQTQNNPSSVQPTAPQRQTGTLCSKLSKQLKQSSGLSSHPQTHTRTHSTLSLNAKCRSREHHRNRASVSQTDANLNFVMNMTTVDNISFYLRFLFTVSNVSSLFQNAIFFLLSTAMFLSSCVQ